MKKQLFTSLLLVSIAFTLNAKVWTVSNNPVAVAQYNTITGAIGAAAAGDTIYVAGSANQYDNIVINKRLTIIGAGFINPNTPTALRTIIGSVKIDSTGIISTSGTKLIGLFINSSIDYNGNSYPKNITIERCLLNYNVYVRADGWLFYNNVIADPIDINNNAITKIYNNIIYYYIDGGGNNISNVVIDHNDFLSGTYTTPFNNLNYATITNNIFYYCGTLNTNCTYNTFSNNITLSSTSTINLPNGPADTYHNNGSGNQNIIDPLFVNVTSTSWNNYSSQDFHLNNGSPAAGKALDGTDLGIYGYQSLAYKWENNFGTSNIPQITQLNIANPNVAKNGTLNVNVTAIIQK